MKGKTGTRYIFTVFFILCGLIIGILGTYGFVAVKHYEGGLLYTNLLVPVLEAKYPGDVIKQDYSSWLSNEPTLWYDIYTREKIEGLPYTTDSNLVWIAIIVGLAYLGLGIGILVKKDLLFKKEEAR